MRIKIINENGNSIEIGSALLRSQLMLNEIDFGNISETVNTDVIYGADGALYTGSSFGTRDINFKFFNMKYNPRAVMTALSPKTSARLEFNNKYYIEGKFISTPVKTRPAYNTDFLYSVTFRSFDPYFKLVGGKKVVSFENQKTVFYENGVYGYQKLTLNNTGDCECPILIKITPNNTSTYRRGLYISAEWNSGQPKYIGWDFSVAAVQNQEYYINTDKRDKNGFKDYNAFRNYQIYNIPAGISYLYAFNAKGSVEFVPRFIDIAEG